MPERSFFYKGRQLPVCARCTGQAVGLSFMPFFLISMWHFPFWVSLALITPCYLDGLIQHFFKYESTNFRRVILGLAAGLGMTSIGAQIGHYLGDYFLNLVIN